MCGYNIDQCALYPCTLKNVTIWKSISNNWTKTHTVVVGSLCLYLSEKCIFFCALITIFRKAVQHPLTHWVDSVNKNLSNWSQRLNVCCLQSKSQHFVHMHAVFWKILFKFFFNITGHTVYNPWRYPVLFSLTQFKPDLLINVWRRTDSASGPTFRFNCILHLPHWTSSAQTTQVEHLPPCFTSAREERQRGRDLN